MHCLVTAPKSVPSAGERQAKSVGNPYSLNCTVAISHSPHGLSPRGLVCVYSSPVFDALIVSFLLARGTAIVLMLPPFWIHIGRGRCEAGHSLQPCVPR